MNTTLMDAPCMPTTHDNTHQTTVRTGWPQPTWAKAGYGVQPDKSEARTVTWSTGMLKAFAEIPSDVINAGGNVAYTRRIQEKAFIDSMNAEMAQTMFYGDEYMNEAEFTGLTAYYNDLNAENGVNIVDAFNYSKRFAAGDLGFSGEFDFDKGDYAEPPSGMHYTSVWIVGWGEETTFCIYPKNFGTGGLVRRDYGEYLSQTAPVMHSKARDGRMPVYGAHYQWNLGFVLADWRYTARLANINIPLLMRADPTQYGSANLVDMLMDTVNQIKNRDVVRLSIYMRRELLPILAKHAKYSTQASTLQREEIYGPKIKTLTLDGIPIHQCDALATMTEGPVLGK